MNPELKKNLSSADHWLRALYVILFLIFAKIAGFLITVVAIAQIIYSLVTGELNRRLLCFGDTLAQYLLAVFNFMVGKAEDKPFPFADWPESTISEVLEAETTNSGEEPVSESAEVVATAAEDNSASSLRREEIADPLSSADSSAVIDNNPENAGDINDVPDDKPKL